MTGARSAQRRPRDERGSAGVLLVTGAAFAIAGVFFVACVFIGWFASIRKAESAAELAALAGVTASVGGEDPCAAAHDAASRNDATVAGCEVRGEGGNVVVEISVTTELTPRLWAGPKSIRRYATAGT